MTYEVIHNQADQRFEIELGDKQSAYVIYKYLDENKAVDFTSTFVPESHRAKGLAAVLVDAAFDWAEAEQLKMLTSCWYAEKKLQRRNQAV